MSTGKLWVASVEFEFVVVAGSKQEALRVARLHVGDALDSGFALPDVDSVTPLTVLAQLPTEWKGCCIPWGEEDDRTCAEILGGEVAP